MKDVYTYARAFLNIINPDEGEVIREGLVFISNIFRKEKDSMKLLLHPAIELHEKHKFLYDVFGSAVNRKVLDFVIFLVEMKKLHLFEKVVEAITEKIDEMLGVQRVVLESPEDLNPSQLERLKNSLEETFKKRIIIERKINKSLIGGYVLRVGNKVLDLSIRDQISELNKILFK